MITLEEAKLYLRVENDEEDSLINSLLDASVELCEGILRFSLDELEEIPDLIKNAILFSTSVMYENRGEINMKGTIDTLKALLAPYRKDSW